jgi:histone deacetylase HOS3
MKNGFNVPDSPQRKVLTPAMVAKDYFSRELANHASHVSQTAVIIHDSCYGHRFSRPRTTKAALSTIVERPERILATLLGATTAYVRLGGRHADSQHPPHPTRDAPTDTIPFQLRKTVRSVPLSHPAVTATHGVKWMEELQIMCDTAEAKLAMNGKELVRPIGYGKDEAGNPLPKLHEGDLYLCAESLAALQGCLGGVCDAIDTVFSGSATKRAFVCIRPPGHHCSSNFPSGFCWLNNVHVGIAYAAMEHGLTHAAIIDFDLHHGDGSQSVTWDHNQKAGSLPKNAAAHKKTPIGYYSLHDINSYPCEYGDEDKVRNASLCIENAHGQSIWNVHLEPWHDHAEFWRLYETRYVTLLEKARKFLRHHSKSFRDHGVQPKAAIFLSAGFDASEWEGAGMQRHGVNVPTDFYSRFTADIVKLASEEDLGVDGRVISVLEGGYSDRALTSGVLSHICGLVDNGVSHEPISRIGSLASSGLAQPGAMDIMPQQKPVDEHDPRWWNLDSLEWIEAIAAGRGPPVAKDKDDKAPGNYSSPTQASSNRMTPVARERHTLTTQLEARLSLMEKPPPPPPDVDWAVAAFELSRLIIPSDRQTLSCRHDELNAEATRARKERQSAIGVATVPVGEPMQLRERKPKAYALPSASRSSSRTRAETRRTTIASFADLPDPNAADSMSTAVQPARSRRRSSAASSIVSSMSDMKLNDENRGTSQPINNAGAVKPRAPTAPQEVSKTMKPPPARRPRAPAIKSVAASRPAAKKSNIAAAPALSRQKSNASDQDRGGAAVTQRNQQRTATPADNASGPADVDNLTNAMGKISIKLKMPSRDEHAAQPKTQQPESKAVKPPRKPAIPRVSKPKSAPDGAKPAGAQVVPNKGAISAMALEEPKNQPQQQAEQILAHAPSESQAGQPQELAIKQENGVPSVMPGVAQQASTGLDTVQAPRSIQMSPPPAPQIVQSTIPSQDVPIAPDSMSASTAPAAAADADAARWTNLQHSHPSDPEVRAQQVGGPILAQQQNFTPMTQMQNQNTDSSFFRPVTPNKRTKDQLTVFTSSSPIPFGKSKVNMATGGDGEGMSMEGQSMEQEAVRDVWALPETPRP